MPTYYHYTSYEGFQGIICSKEIWLTNVNRPDDPLEATVSKEEFVSALKKCSDRFGCIDAIIDLIDDERISYLNKKLRNSQYAFSLTKLKDNKGHWKKYGDDGKGVCIGFDLDVLKSLCKTGPFLNEDVIDIVDIGYGMNYFEKMIEKDLKYIEYFEKPDIDLLVELLHADIAIRKKSPNVNSKLA